MSAPRMFKFYLLDETGKYYYVSNDTVQLSTDKIAITNTPEGWQEMKIQIGRGDDFGINSSITAPLRFWGDGKKILQYIYYLNGRINFNAYCKCIIEQRIDYDGSRVWQYEQLGNDFVIDFANEQSSTPVEQGGYFVVGLNEDNVLERLRSNENTEFDIEFDTDSINVELEGVELQSNYEWLASGGSAVSIISGGTTNTVYVIPMGLIKEETDYFRNQIVTQNSGAEVYAASGNPPNDINKILYTDLALTNVPYTLEGQITFQNTGGATGAQVIVEMVKKNTTTNTIVANPVLYNSTIGLVGTVVLPISVSGTLNFDPLIYTYFLTVRVGATSTQNVAVQIDNIDFNLRITSTLPTSYTNSFTYNTFASKFIPACSNGEAAMATSSFLNLAAPLNDLPNYFNNLPSYTNVTSGNAIRGLADDGIKSTLSKLKQDAYARWMCGMDVTGNVVRFERLQYFFDSNTVIAVFNEVSELTKRTALDYLYSDVKAGYEDVTLDKLNAKYEINSEQNYSLFLKRITQSLDLIAPYHAGVYEIEYLRGDLNGKNTTDNKGDNNVFLLEVSNVISGGNNTLLKYSNPPDSLSGVFSPYTHYNWGLAPDLFIYRHSPYFKSILSVPDTIGTADRVTFVSAKKNDNYIKYIGGYTISGGDDVYLTSPYLPNQGSKLFLPEIYEFTCEATDNIVNKIRDNKYGVIGFYDEGVYRSGFIIDAEITPSNMSNCRFTLLAAGETQ